MSRLSTRLVKMCLYEYDEEKQREFDREEGKQELLREQVQKNLEKGYSKEMIADFLGIDAEMIAEIMNDGLIKVSQK